VIDFDLTRRTMGKRNFTPRHEPIRVRFILIAILLLLIFVTNRCAAAETAVTFGAGQTHIPIHYQLPDDLRRVGFYTETRDTSNSVHLAVFRRWDRFSLGLGYHDLGDYSVCAKHPLLNGQGACAFATLRAYSVESNLRLYGPVYASFSAYRATASGSLVIRLAEKTAWVPVAGLGLRTPLGSSTFMRAEVRYPTAPRFMLGLEWELK
jgi:hypothetical protein